MLVTDFVEEKELYLKHSIKVATYKTKIIYRKLLKSKLHSLLWVEEWMQ
jgi:hypothetical protein